MSDFICFLLALVVVVPFFVWVGQVGKAKVRLIDQLVNAKHEEVRQRKERAAQRQAYEDKFLFNPKEVLDPFAEDNE